MVTQIDVFSGFLGAGKTTLIKKLLREAYAGQKVVLIENEFGEIGVDGGFMKEAGIAVTEMNSGCICCSLVGDFGRALRQVLDTYHPDRILIEPSGVGKLSDVVRAASAVCGDDCKIGALVAVVDAGKCKMYAKNFGEFFLNQIEYAAAVVLSRTDTVSADKLNAALALIREHNPAASVITTPWSEIDGGQILRAMEKEDTLAGELAKMAADAAAQQDDDDDDDDEHEHHHHHGEGKCDDPDCECHHHDDDDDEHEHEHEHHHHHGEGECDDPDCECHHHHDDDDDEDEHEHHHHHGEGECDDPDCGCHHHHHHHADEVFTSWGVETPKAFTEEALGAMLAKLTEEATYGMVLRAKGILPVADGGWIHFDYTPGESNIRRGSAEVTGRLCVIGSHLREDALAALFGVS